MRLWEIQLSDQSVIFLELEDSRNLTQEFMKFDARKRKPRFFAPTPFCCVHGEAIMRVELFDPTSIQELIVRHSPASRGQRKKKSIGY